MEQWTIGARVLSAEMRALVLNVPYRVSNNNNVDDDSNNNTLFYLEREMRFAERASERERESKRTITSILQSGRSPLWK